MVMSEQRNRQWQDILQMTEQLHQLSEEENWQLMIELESKRFSRLKHFFSIPVSDAEAADIAEGIRHIAQSDENLLQLGKLRQQQTSESVQKISSGRQAIKTYRNFQD